MKAELLVLVSIILTVFSILFMLFQGKKGGEGLIGRPTIPVPFFFLGKGSAVVIWGLILLQALGKDVSFWNGADFLRWIGTLLLFSVPFIAFAAGWSLGGSIRVGLPQKKTTLRTSGIYRFSRNPLYLALDLSAIGGSLFSPSPWMIILALLTILIHHWIIREEEDFLSKRFGAEWEAYCSRVRRYL